MYYKLFISKDEGQERYQVLEEFCLSKLFASLSQKVIHVLAIDKSSLMHCMFVS